jgi:hypothetical protein
MRFCTGCGKSIHERAVSCPQCGAVTNPAPFKPLVHKASLGMSIAALVLGALTMVGLLDEDKITRETLLGGALFVVIGLTMAVINVSQPHTRNPLAITAVVVCAIAALALLGSI